MMRQAFFDWIAKDYEWLKTDDDFKQEAITILDRIHQRSISPEIRSLTMKIRLLQ